ncbi:terminase small subunit [Eremococcus coleocola]|uniref:terminase small subunit n=1 Tax=Eremococcus coleocola TaxID=88132 RepID=UPI000688484C|nr:terminase small subunit [Eremococcus coleocola]
MLTAKQEKFVQGLVSGLSQRQAYINAYPTSKDWKHETVDSKASNLLKHDKVLARYNELMDEFKERALFTREDAVNYAKWLLEQAKHSIIHIDDGYVRQGTSSAYLGALEKIISLELLDPITAAQHEKLRKDISQSNELVTINIQPLSRGDDDD